MTLGSKIFTTQPANHPHLLAQGPGGGGGALGEIGQLRSELIKEFAPHAAIAVEEFTPATASANAIKLSVASNVAAQVYSGATLDGATGGAVMSPPRNATFTTTDNSGHAGYAGNVTFTGLDVNGHTITEVLAVVNNTTVTGVKAFKQITQINVDAQPDGFGAFTFGFGTLIGLQKKITACAGATTALPPFREYVNHATPTAGVLDPSHRTYAPNAAPNGTNVYRVYYDFDPTTA